MAQEGSRLRLICCDCGLVHDVLFRYEGNATVATIFRRNEKATVRVRRERAKREANNEM